MVIIISVGEQKKNYWKDRREGNSHYWWATLIWLGDSMFGMANDGEFLERENWYYFNW